MRILYLTISNLDMNSSGIYQDLIKELKKNNHDITIVMANEKKYLKKTSFKLEGDFSTLRVKIGNQFGVNFVKKGINNLLLEKQFKKAINKYLSGEKFDLILYATPPVTFSGVIRFCKEKYQARTYLMLKDIFPQNAVDIGLIKRGGIVYNIFKKKEKKLYENSDNIGCMSMKNIEYLLKNNSWINNNKVHLFPNTIKPSEFKWDKKYTKYRAELNIPEEVILFVFGGNLGRPQGIDFLIKSIKSVENNPTFHFIIVGNGSEKEKIKLAANEINNLTFIEKLSKSEYEDLINECDVGIISLDYRFTIPNYPSRILSYMDKGIPILACTDINTDVKQLIEDEAKCGIWCYSNDLKKFVECLSYFQENKENLKEIGYCGRKYLERNFNVKKSINIIENRNLM
ncbi:MAG: glycosyltransferase family 4 protein [Cetobacterium sp.]